MTGQWTSVESQLDPCWLTWLSAKETHLETFFTHDLADPPDNPYSAAGLECAAAVLIARYAGVRCVPLSESVIDRFAVFVGQVFAESAGGTWINDAAPGSARPWPMILLPDSGRTLCVRSLVTTALHHCNGAIWIHEYRHATTGRAGGLTPSAVPVAPRIAGISGHQQYSQQLPGPQAVGGIRTGESTTVLHDSVGPIRPEHATGGWELRSNSQRAWLVKSYERCRGRVRATTSTTCAWTITAPDGAMLREASCRSVDTAKADADAWVAQHPGNTEPPPVT